MKTVSLAPFAMLALAPFAGCTCANASSGGAAPSPAASASSSAKAATAASASVRASASAAAPAPPTSAGQTAGAYSAPIDATRTGSGGVTAAALVAGDKKVVVTGIDASGNVAFTTDAIRGVAWSPDARVTVFSVSDGAAVVWGGPHQGGSGQAVALVGAKGALAGPAFEIGTSMPCATGDAFVWSDRKNGKGPHQIRARGLEGAPRDVASFASDGSVELACGDHLAYAVVEGDEDGRTVRVLDPSSADAGAVKAVSVNDPDDDDEADFEEYTVGDDLGLLRVGKSGSVNVRELASGKLGPWRRVGHDLGNDDDVEVVDGDAMTTYVVYTTDEGDSCGSTEAAAKSVWVLRVDRKTGKSDAPAKLAAAECGKDVGPFWIGSPASGMVASWAERGQVTPVRGFAFHALSAASDGAPVGRADQSADALTDAGCDGTSCVVVALSREGESDGMAPEPLKLLRYP